MANSTHFLRTKFLHFAMVVAILAGHAGQTPAAEQTTKPAPVLLAVPDAAAQTAAEKKVRDAFGNQDRAGADARAEAASKMFDAISTAQDDPATLYMLLKRSGELAASAGEAELALKSAAKLGTLFGIDADELSAQLLHKGSLAPASAALGKKFVDACLKFASELTGKQKYDLSLRVLGAAETVSRNAKDGSLRVLVQTATLETRNFQADSVRSKSAEAKLAKNPDDANANYEFGRFQCLAIDNWIIGLPALAKGSNSAFQAAAAADLAKPTELAAQVEAGDRWWDLGDKETGQTRTALRHRAVLWYEKANHDTKLNGLAKIKIEKRLRTATDGPEIARPTGGELGHPRNKAVVYLPGSGRQDVLFRQLSNGAITVAKPAVFLAGRSPLAKAGILVLGNDCFQSTPAADLNEKAETRLKDFVSNGGDLIVFEQQSAEALGLIERAFKIKVELKNCLRVAAVPRELAAAVEAAGLMTDAHRDPFTSSNLYTVPEDASIFYRGGDATNDDPVVAASVPVGKGRLILIGNNMETTETPWDEQLLDYLYHYRKPGAKPVN